MTGASSGLGEALLQPLLKKTKKLTVIGRKNPGIPGIDFLKADLSNPEAVENLRSKLDPKIDLFISCAGQGTTGLTEEIPADAFQRAMNINFFSVVQLTQMLLPRMKKNGGTLLFVTSGVATRGLPFTAPYSAAKAALNNFSESLRTELDPYPVDVLLFSPGPIASRFHENRQHFGKGVLESPKFHGAPPEKVAAALIKALSMKKPRTTLGFKARLAEHLKYWVPRVTDKIVAWQYRLNRASDT